jgi:RNA polymerase sigma-70 factor (ECF subfamily)
MLGSQADAEDSVQEAWLRLARHDAAAIDNLAGWLTTVVDRVCIDMLRSRKARPEASYDDRLPELVVAEDGGGAPEDDALLAESVGLALLVVLDTLRPTERLAHAARHVRGAVRGDRSDHRQVHRGYQDARQPGPPGRTGHASSSR